MILMEALGPFRIPTAARLTFLKSVLSQVSARVHTLLATPFLSSTTAGDARADLLVKVVSSRDYARLSSQQEKTCIMTIQDLHRRSLCGSLWLVLPNGFAVLVDGLHGYPTLSNWTCFPALS